MALRHGEKVLDVACGTGNLAIPAARSGARVSGIDIAPNLIAQARLLCTRCTLELRFPFPPEAVTELFATCYGPTVATLRAADPKGASRLRGELARLFQKHNVADDDATTVVGEYLDVQARVA